MSNYTNETVSTEFVQAGGVRFAYWRFGRRGGHHYCFPTICR